MLRRNIVEFWVRGNLNNSDLYVKLDFTSFDMAESEERDVSFGESDSDSSFEVIEDPENPRVST